MNSPKTKRSYVHRLPTLYFPALIKSDYEYQREIRRRMDQLEQETHDINKRRMITDRLFAHEHLKKRHQWFQNDRSYRDACRASWKKKGIDESSFLPSIFPRENSSTNLAVKYQITENDSAMTANEKIKQKFLRTQPVMVEILNAPHSYEAFKYKFDVASRKKSAQRRHVQIQSNAIVDQRYLRLVGTLQNS